MRGKDGQKCNINNWEYPQLRSRILVIHDTVLHKTNGADLTYVQRTTWKDKQIFFFGQVGF